LPGKAVYKKPAGGDAGGFFASRAQRFNGNFMAQRQIAFAP
jgi:hypothetical protein